MVWRRFGRKSPSKDRARLRLENLEDRNLLSTISWTNRGSAGNDSDSFNAVFGANAALARSVVDAAIATWQNIVQDFHYADGSNTFNLNLSADTNSHGTGAVTWTGVQTDGQGRPKMARVEIDSGGDGHGAGYFLDANPYGSPAFQGSLLNPFARGATPGSSAAQLGDLFTVVAHEVTHCLGINSDPGEAFQRNVHGFLRSTHVPDAVDHPGSLFTFSGPDVNALFTSDDGESVDNGAATHAASAGNTYVDPVSHQTFSGSVDLMNPTYLYGRRVLPSTTIALVLKDAYGYSINVPSGFNPQPAIRQFIPPVENSASAWTGPIVATGSTAGGMPLVQVFDPSTSTLRYSFFAYEASFTGGVQVTVMTINGTRVIVTAPGPGTTPRVRIFNAADGTLLREFLAYEPNYFGGVTLAAGDVNGDGAPDIVTGSMTGNPQVKVFDGKALATGTFDNANPDASLLTQFFAYPTQFNVGVNVAVGDVNGDGYADIVTGATAGNPHVKVFDGHAIAAGTFDPASPDNSLITQFFAYGLQFNVGVNVAVGDIEGDGHADIVTGATIGNPHVKVYSGQAITAGSSGDAALVGQFFAYGLQFDIGVSVAVADIEGDGHADIITGAAEGSPHIKIYSGKNFASAASSGTLDGDVIAQFFANDSGFQGGVTVGAAK